MRSRRDAASRNRPRRPRAAFLTNAFIGWRSRARASRRSNSGTNRRRRANLRCRRSNRCEPHPHRAAAAPLRPVYEAAQAASAFPAPAMAVEPAHPVAIHEDVAGHAVAAEVIAAGRACRAAAPRATAGRDGPAAAPRATASRDDRAAAPRAAASRDDPAAHRLSPNPSSRTPSHGPLAGRGAHSLRRRRGRQGSPAACHSCDDRARRSARGDAARGKARARGAEGRSSRPCRSPIISNSENRSG